MAYAFQRCFQQRRGQSRVMYFYDEAHSKSYSGAIMSLYQFNIAWNLSWHENHKTRGRWIYLSYRKAKRLNSHTVMSRFNAILERENLPALRVVKRKWVFDDGVPWAGSRLFRLAMPHKEYSVAEALEMIRSHP